MEIDFYMVSFNYAFSPPTPPKYCPLLFPYESIHFLSLFLF